MEGTTINLRIFLSLRDNLRARIPGLSSLRDKTLLILLFYAVMGWPPMSKGDTADHSLFETIDQGCEGLEQLPNYPGNAGGGQRPQQDRTWYFRSPFEDSTSRALYAKQGDSEAFSRAVFNDVMLVVNGTKGKRHVKDKLQLILDRFHGRADVGKVGSSSSSGGLPIAGSSSGGP